MLDFNRKYNPKVESIVRNLIESCPEGDDVDLWEKNKFVLNLRDHLMSVYGTSHQYTFGAEDIEAERIGDMYVGVTRDSNKQRDYSGFVLRKDLLNSYSPDLSSKVLLDQIHSFASQEKNIESKLEKTKSSPIVGDRLSLKIGTQKYSVNVHIEGGCSGEIGVYLTKSNLFNLDNVL
ncbi:MAG: hypothetical protein ABIB43_00425 [archaeon]